MTQMQVAGRPNDVELANLPADGISAVSWSPQADFLAVGSWSNEVRIYSVDSASGNASPAALYSHEQPVLDVCWSKDGTKVVSVGCDNAGRMLDVATGQSMQVAVHDAPIRKAVWVDVNGGLLATGGWDRKLNYWDLRQPTPVLSVTLPERIYAMDARFPFVVVGTAKRTIHVYDLHNPSVEQRSLDSPLKWQTRTIACSLDARQFAIASLEGRVAIRYTDPTQASNDYTFRCHRTDQPTPGRPHQKTTKVWTVNDVVYHPYGTFATAGSDGSVSIWDGDAKSRLKSFDNLGGPVTSCAFNRTGTLLAMAISYDWSKGHAGAIGDPNKVVLHPVRPEEVQRRHRR